MTIFKQIANFYLHHELFIRVVDPKLFITDPDRDFSMSFGSGSNFQTLPDPVSDPTFFLKKYYFKGPKMAFQNIILKEYLNLVPVY
jgi:hypothetical protein